VFKLSSLFAADAFAGGFILQSFVAYWFTGGLMPIPGQLTVFSLNCCRVFRTGCARLAELGW
jgi:hypothetical protein